MQRKDGWREGAVGRRRDRSSGRAGGFGDDHERERDRLRNSARVSWEIQIQGVNPPVRTGPARKSFLALNTYQLLT